MGELFGVLVIAISSLGLFALASLQLAHRVLGPRVDAIASAVVLAELDDAPFRLVASVTLAIAVSSQLPVAHLLGSRAGELSTASVAVLVIEAVAATAWSLAMAAAPRVRVRMGWRSAARLERIATWRRRAA
jgi:hypothetical protein